MLSDIVNRESAIPLDSPDVPTLDQQFHATIAEASDNGVLVCLVAALHQLTEPVHSLGRKTVRQHQCCGPSVRGTLTRRSVPSPRTFYTSASISLTTRAESNRPNGD